MTRIARLSAVNSIVAGNCRIGYAVHWFKKHAGTTITGQTQVDDGAIIAIDTDGFAIIAFTAITTQPRLMSYLLPDQYYSQ